MSSVALCFPRSQFHLVPVPGLRDDFCLEIPVSTPVSAHLPPIPLSAGKTCFWIERMRIVPRVMLVAAVRLSLVLGVIPCCTHGQLISAPQPGFAVASSRLPDWDPSPLSTPLPGLFPATLVARPIQPIAPAPSFLASRGNRALVAADFGVRMLDTFSSWMDRPAACAYCSPEVVLPQAWSNSLPTMLVFSTTVSATVDLSARFLWRRHHPGLARIAILSDIVGDGEAGIGNVYVYARAQSYAAALRAERPAAPCQP